MKIGTDRRSMFYGADSKTFETARRLRKNATLEEKVLWSRLKNNKVLGVKFRQQHPVRFYIVDFYCHELKLAIEVDGEIHFDIENSEYDKRRTAELENLGITVLRFSNHEVLFNLDLTLEKIQLIIAKLRTEQCPPISQD